MASTPGMVSHFLQQMVPDHDQRLLKADINLYVLPTTNNVLYVQVTNVLTAMNANWFGTAFDNVTQTGVRITFPDSSLLTSGVSFSNNFANSGEVLADGTSGSETISSLSDTPGFGLTVTGSALLIHTTNGANNGFTSLCCIVGATRIRGSGVFQLTFAQSIDLTRIDFRKALVALEAEYGGGNQYIPWLDNSPSNASSLAFSTQPANGVARTANAPVSVQVQDSLGNLVSSSNASISLISIPAAVSVTVSAVNGLATFNNLVFDTSGNYQLVWTCPVF